MGTAPSGRQEHRAASARTEPCITVTSPLQLRHSWPASLFLCDARRLTTGGLAAARRAIAAYARAPRGLLLCCTSHRLSLPLIPAAPVSAPRRCSGHGSRSRRQRRPRRRRVYSEGSAHGPMRPPHLVDVLLQAGPLVGVRDPVGPGVVVQVDDDETGQLTRPDRVQPGEGFPARSCAARSFPCVTAPSSCTSVWQVVRVVRGSGGSFPAAAGPPALEGTCGAAPYEASQARAP